MNKIQKTVAAGAFALAGLFALTGCSSYEAGEVTEVEEDEGEHGPVLELEVVRTKIENSLEEPDTYEVHVPTDSGCEVGDIYDRTSKTCS